MGSEVLSGIAKGLKFMAWAFFVGGFAAMYVAGNPSEAISYARFTADEGANFGMAACAWFWADRLSRLALAQAQRAAPTEGAPDGN